MAIEAAGRDPNYTPTLMGMDLSTGKLPTRVYVDESTHRLLVNAVVSGTMTVQDIAAEASLSTIATNTGNSATAANQTNGNQQTRITDGTNVANVLTPAALTAAQTGQNGIINAPTGVTTSLITLTSSVLATSWYDLLNYPSVHVEIVSNASAAVITFQSVGDSSFSNINSTPLYPINNTGVLGPTVSTNGSGAWDGPRGGRFFRLNTNLTGANTITLYITFNTFTYSARTLAVNLAAGVGIGNTGSTIPGNAFYAAMIDSSGNLVGMGNIARDGDANTGNNALSNGTIVYNGSSYDRQRSASAASNTTGTGLLGTGILGFDGTNYQRVKLDTAGDQLVIGATASGSSLTVAPVTEGGLAKTANPTAVTDGQVVNATFDKLGKQVVVGSIRDLKVNTPTTITNSTAETTVLTAVASTFLDVYGVIVANTSAAACSVAFKDATAGTTQFTVDVPAGDTRGFMLGESAAVKQGTVNNNWTATCSGSVSSIVITMLAVKNI